MMKEKDRRWWIQIAWASTMGISMVVAMIISVAIGIFLDNLLSTQYLKLVFIGVGIFAAYRSMWHIYTKYLRNSPKEPDERGEKY